jgi:hypothetical protein
MDFFLKDCCFSAKQAALRRKSKDWLARNQDNMSEWGDMSIRGLLFSELAGLRLYWRSAAPQANTAGLGPITRPI